MLEHKRCPKKRQRKLAIFFDLLSQKYKGPVLKAWGKKKSGEGNQPNLFDLKFKMQMQSSVGGS